MANKSVEVTSLAKATPKEFARSASRLAHLGRSRPRGSIRRGAANMAGFSRNKFTQSLLAVASGGLETFFHKIVMIRNNLRVFAPGSIRALACRVWCPRRTLFQPGAHALLRFAHHVQHPSLISIVMELSYEAKRRVAPASCWPRPSDAGTSACSGVSSARVTATVALRRRVRHPPLSGVNLTALGLREAKGHTSKTRTTSSEPVPGAAPPLHSFRSRSVSDYLSNSARPVETS